MIYLHGSVRKRNLPDRRDDERLLVEQSRGRVLRQVPQCKQLKEMATNLGESTTAVQHLPAKVHNFCLTAYPANTSPRSGLHKQHARSELWA